MTDVPARWSSQWLFVPYLGIALLIFAALIQYNDAAEERDQKQRVAFEMRLEAAQARDAWARYDNSIAACQRGNTVRKQTDDLRDGVVQLNTILAAFMDRSAELQELAERDPQAAEALKARNRIREIAKDLPHIEQVDCEVTIVAPFVPRPAKTP